MASPPKPLTDPTRFFLEPQQPRHRQYEALRAYFAEGMPSTEAARRFGYTPGAFRVLCHAFRHGRQEFFTEAPRGPQVQTKKDPARPLIIALRKQNLSIYDIHDALTRQGRRLSLTAIHEVLRAEGFARLPRRRDEERPERPRPDRAAVADVRQFRVAPRRFATAMGGLFVFVPWLVRLGLDDLIQTAGFPGTRMIPAAPAVRAALALKLTSTERRSHVMDLVFDEGLALWAGLNVLPKTTYLSQYSGRLGPRRLTALLDGWVTTLRDHHVVAGQSFNLDFHSIPFFGADVLRRRRVHREALRLPAQSAPEERAGLPGQGRRHPRAVLLQRRPAQGRRGGRGARLRALLDAADRAAAAAPGLRLAAHHLRQPGRVAHARHHLHHLAAPHAGAAPGDGPAPAGGLADRPSRRPPSALPDAPGHRPAGAVAPVWPRAAAAALHQRPGSRAAHRAAHQRPTRHAGCADHPVRSADAHRERPGRRRELPASRCAQFGRRAERQLRCLADHDRDGAVPRAGAEAPRLRARPAPAGLAPLSEESRSCPSDTDRGRRRVAPTCPQPHPHRLGPARRADDRAVVERPPAPVRDSLRSAANVSGFGSVKIEASHD